MKKNNFVSICSLVLCLTIAQGIRTAPAANTSSSLPSCLSLLHTVYKIGQATVLSGIGYTFLRYLNDWRNTSRAAQIKFIPAKNGQNPELHINTNGTICIDGNSDTFNIHSERIRREQSIPTHNRLQQFWQWFIQPAHQIFVRHVISVPKETCITAHSSHNYKPTAGTINIKGISGSIDAKAQSGDINITDPESDVTVTTPDSAYVTNFGHNLTITAAHTIHTNRSLNNREGRVIIDETEHKRQSRYDLAYQE